MTRCLNYSTTYHSEICLHDDGPHGEVLHTHIPSCCIRNCRNTDFTLFPVWQKTAQNDFILPWPSPFGKTQLVERSHSKSLNDSTHCFNGTYSAACVSFGVIDCISLAASRPPHLDVSIQASWQLGFFPRLSAVSAKLQGSCFFCSSIFWLRQYCEKGEAGRWIRRATEGEEEKKQKHLSAPRSPSQAWPRTHRKPLFQIRYKLVSSAQLTCLGRAVRRRSDADKLQARKDMAVQDQAEWSVRPVRACGGADIFAYPCSVTWISLRKLHIQSRKHDHTTQMAPPERLLGTEKEERTAPPRLSERYKLCSRSVRFPWCPVMCDYH